MVFLLQDIGPGSLLTNGIVKGVPEHTGARAVELIKVGKGFTITVTVSVLSQSSGVGVVIV